ncbi:MAG: Hepatitis C virus core protein [Prochlorococcaceae cyanobacterium]|jgi:hypothetical protein
MQDPPLGYQSLAWLGLIANLLALPFGLGVIALDPYLRVANLVVVTSAVLPTAVVGLVASIALLRWRRWGQILAIVALSLSLAVSLPYGIVRLALVAADRPLVAVLAPLLWIANIALLVYWCRPVHRHYLG